MIRNKLETVSDRLDRLIESVNNNKERLEALEKKVDNAFRWLYEKAIYNDSMLRNLEEHIFKKPEIKVEAQEEAKAEEVQEEIELEEAKAEEVQEVQEEAKVEEEIKLEEVQVEEEDIKKKRRRMIKEKIRKMNN